MRSVTALVFLALATCAAHAQSVGNGCIYQASPTQLADRQYGLIHCDPNGYVLTTPSSTVASPAVSVQSSQFPANAVPLSASATGTTAAVVATLPADAARTNYLCSFQIDADATAATEGSATITGLLGGTMTIRQSVAALANGTASRWHDFSPCLPASGVNTAITLTTVAAGSGGNTAANVAGFKQ